MLSKACEVDNILEMTYVYTGSMDKRDDSLLRCLTCSRCWGIAKYLRRDGNTFNDGFLAVRSTATLHIRPILQISMR